MSNMTYEQMYEVPVRLVLNGDTAGGIKVEYGHCGSHQIIVSGTASLENLRYLRDRLNQIPGIDS